MEHYWIAVFTILAFASRGTSERVVLMKTPDCNSCVWTWDRLPLLPNAWHYPILPGTPKNRYVVCDVSSPQEPNYWLRSDIISVGQVQRVDVTVTYFTKKCQQSYKYCSNTSFSAYVWESNVSVTKRLIPHPVSSFGSYRRFATINRQNANPSILTIPLPLNSKFIVLGFRDQGGCRTLFSVKVTYDVCPGKPLINSLVSLPQTLVPINNLKPIEVNGSCTENSFQAVEGSLSVLCESTGEWNTSRLQGRCVCKEDMENNGGICKACSPGTFNDGKGLNCTVLPSEPRAASVPFVNQSSAVITWSSPAVTGAQTHVLYDVECEKSCEYYGKDCDGKTCDGDRHAMEKKGLNMSHVIITNLPSFVNYTCKITAKNRVSEVAKNRVSEVAERRHRVKANFTTVNLRTEGSVPGKPEVDVHLAEDATIELSWKLKCKNGVIKEFHVTYFRVDDTAESETLTTKETKVQIEGLTAGKTFEFQVIAINNYGRGLAGVKTFEIPKGDLIAKSEAVIAGAAGGGALLIIVIVVIIIVIVFRFRRRSPRNIQKDYMRTIEQGSDLPMDQRRYIDPGNYLDIMELLSTFTSEIERSKTKLDGLIGQGEFADVYKGTLQTPKGKHVVAVKVLRPGSNEKNQKDFLSEASIMGQFTHPNVIALVGVVTQSRPMMILTEFLESGSLDHFLKVRKGQLTTIQLLGMARGVASGMVYLSEMNFIHRDLAARNILVGENMSCKVSDFGLSRELADDNPNSEYQTQGGKIPVRWTAPEALQHRKFSSSSDVWSYGILLWEIMSFADRPYWDWNNYDVISRVETGYRLPPPTGCPKIVHGLMLECWETDKNKRPKFADIVTRLDELFRFPEVLNDDLLSVTNSPKEDSLPEFKSVDEWLKFINMEKYLDVFHAANVNSIDKVTRLQERDLKEMGIKLIGHRNKMHKSIKAMKAQFFKGGLDEDEAAI